METQPLEVAVADTVAESLEKSQKKEFVEIQEKADDSTLKRSLQHQFSAAAGQLLVKN